MSNFPYQIKDIKALLPKLETKDLEAFMLEIRDIINNRKTTDKAKEETELLKSLNELALPQNKLERYLFLRRKRNQSTLNSKEEKEFFDLIEEEQLLQIKRIHIVGELANLKGVPVLEMAASLGINPPASA